MDTGFEPPPPESRAEAAGLVHISDAVPGIGRRRRGSGFSYAWPDGRAVRDAATLARIRALAIPPAYTHVWIAPDARAHMQATGRDARGRKQYRYHPDWEAERDVVKADLLVAFADALPRIRARTDHDLRRRKPGQEAVIASIVWLLDNLLIRVGSPQYAAENGSYGLTTLKRRHARIEGSTLRLRFRGKSGREWNLHHSDRRVARIIRSIQELPGQHLFQYIDADGTRHPVQSADVNAYIREAAGGDFTSRQFRNWAATVLTAAELSQMEPAASKRETARILNTVIDRVADRLGNTRAVCWRSYIHPGVIECFSGGRLAEELSLAGNDGADAGWLSPDEIRARAWLRRQIRQIRTAG